MSAPEPPRNTAPSAGGAVVARALAVLGGRSVASEPDPDRERVVTIAAGAAVAATLVVAVLLLLRPAGETRVQASPVDDSRATLTPVDVGWDPGDGREGATTGGGGMSGGGGAGAFSFFSRGSGKEQAQDCIPAGVALPDAVRNAARGGAVHGRTYCPPSDVAAR